MFVSVRAILHIDMDAFFASVEQTRRPELRGRPVVVGGEHGGRGVVSTASYEARAFGVRTAMPIAHAERLCPHAVFLSVDMAAYTAAAERVIEICRRFTDLVEVASIDEAFLDVTGSRRLFGPPATIASRIQELVYDECGLTCSIGIAENKLLAKLASNLKKPCGMTALSGADIRGRLRDLPVRDLWGIGPVTEERLAALGLTTIGMLQDVPFSLLAAAFGKGAYGLRQIAFGRSLSPLRAARPLPKSIGRETTFAEDSNDREFLAAALLMLVDQVMTSLRKKGLAARTVTVKVRYSTFHTVSRRATLPRTTASTRQICRTVAGLFSAVDLEARWVRLVGVSVGDLTHDAFQLTFDEHWKDVALGDAVDRIRAKYGRRAVALAVAALAESRRVKAQPMC